VSLLNNPEESRIQARELDHSSKEGVSITKLVVFSEEDVYLPCLFFKPEGPGSVPAVLLADSDGKTSHNVDLAMRMAGEGYGLLIVDLRGYGETKITRRSSRDEAGGFEAQTLGVEAGIAYDGLKLGRSIFAMRVFDLRQTLEYLSSRDDIDSDRIALIGRKSCGPLALYTALLEENLRGVLVDGSLSTFSRLVTSRLYKYHFMDFLPRVLRYHDLPQVAGAIAPRVIWMADLKDAYKETLGLSAASQDYDWTTRCYIGLGERENFRVVEIESDSEQAEVYLEWAEEALVN
jgi:dienelactone hydrolase